MKNYNKIRHFRIGAFSVVGAIVLFLSINYFVKTDSLLYKSIIGSLSALFMLYIVTFFHIRSSKKVSSRDLYYFFHPYRYVPYHFWISIIWTFFFVSIIMFLAKVVLGNTVVDDITNLGYLITIISSLAVGTWGAFMTLIVLRQQKQEIVGIKNFLSEMIDIFSNWKIEIENEKNRNNEKIRELYYIGYNPFPGSISIPDEKIFQVFKDNLIELSGSKHVRIKIICFGKLKHDEILHNLKIPVENIEKLKDRIAEDINDLHETANGQKENVAIWKSNNLNPFHFLIADNIAYQFSIVPSSKKEQNDLLGIKTEDVFIVEFLKKTFEEIEKQAITPNYRFNVNHIFSFENQYNLEKIIMTIYTTEKQKKSIKYKKELFKYIDDKHLIEISCDSSDLKEGDEVSFKLLKKDAEEDFTTSVESNMIIIKEAKC